MLYRLERIAIVTFGARELTPDLWASAFTVEKGSFDLKAQFGHQVCV